MSAPELRVLPDPAGLASAIADAFTDAGRAAVSLRGRFLLALNGGSTPQRLFDLFGTEPYRSLEFWPSTEIFWGDERCVLAGQPGSNYRQAWEAFLQYVPVPPGQVHRIEGELSPETAAAAYAAVLAREAPPGLAWPRFDLALLGLGRDGHTASLPSGVTFDGPGGPVRAVAVKYEGRPAERITLMPEVFNDARAIFWMAEGRAKADIVRTVLQGERDPVRLPAQRIRLLDGVQIWWLDREAASQLTSILG